jgi:hypothetical protein
VRTTDELGRWGGASTDEAARSLSTLSCARKLFAGLSRCLEGVIDRQQTALEIETDASKIADMTELVRQNRKALQTVLDTEVMMMRESRKQRPGEGVIDLAEARAEVARRLDRLTG